MAIAQMRVPTIFTAVDKFSDVVNTMAKNATKFGNAAEGAASRIGTKMTSMGKSMMTTSAVMLGSLAYPIHKAVEFEDQIASIATLLPELNSKGIQKLGDDIINMAIKTSTPIEELTKSYYDLISAGVANKNATAWLKSGDKLAIAGLGTLVESTNIELAAMRNFSKDFKNTEEAANALFKTVKYGKTTVGQLSEAFAANSVFAGGLGVTGQEYMASIAAITTSTMPTGMAEIAIGGLANAMSKTTEKKNKVLFGLLKKMNIKSSEELLQKKGGFLPALTAIKEEAEKAGVKLESVFGLKQASTAFIMLTRNQKVLDKYQESLKSINDKNEDALSIAYQLKMATGKFGIGKLKNNLDSVAITVGTILIPAIIELTENLNPMLKEFRAWVKHNPGVITGFAKLAVAIGAIGLALNVGGWLLKFGAFVHSLPSLGGIASTAFGTIELWAGYAGMTVGALLGTIALVIAGIGILAWIAIDMFQHWEDWRDIVVNLAVPFGTLITLVEKLFSYSEKIQNAFRFEGFLSGIKAIGIAIVDWILTPLIKIMEIQSRLLFVGKYFKNIADILKAVKPVTPNTPVAPTSPIVPVGGSPSNKPNLAGKSKNEAKEYMDFISKKASTLNLNLTTPNGFGLEPDGATPSGIVVHTKTNQGSR